MERQLPEVPLFDRVRIQAEVLVPLVTALERRLGVEEAHQLVREALGAEWRARARGLVREHGDSRGALLAHAEESMAGDHLAVQWLEFTDDIARLEITSCEYARFYQELGEPELGHLLVCENDDWFIEALDDIDFERRHTIMQGAATCDFCYRRRGSSADAPPS
ncbi:MAG: L-2-amino-thiazoline-4-carboxylic acid hydrolase [Acidimicrobiales bacterium]|jgi:hypothetical protein|nr:L-2-amino-thiazoline-4-carboxylic acid hydrolase [Acidimicrobiales bacterium]